MTAKPSASGMATCVCGAVFRARVRSHDDRLGLTLVEPTTCPACDQDTVQGFRGEPEVWTMRPNG